MLKDLFKAKKYKEQSASTNDLKGNTDDRGIWWPPSVNGVLVPYDMSIMELKEEMNVSMAQYAAVCVALAKKKEKAACRILLGELKNKDYYKRRLALENLQMSIYWKESVSCLKELLYDRNVYVVRAALRGIIMNQIDGCKEDIELIAEIWNKDEDIQNYSREILKDYAINKTSVLHVEDKKLFLRSKEKLIFRGASQAKPEQYTKDYMEIVLRHFPQYNTNQVRDLLHRLAREGCGYAALTLSLYKRYWYERDEFKKIFGIPMFNGFGEMTYNELMVDFYCMTDEPGIGMTLKAAKERWAKFCHHYKIKLAVKLDIKITPDIFWEESKTGDIIMLANHFTMYDLWNNSVNVKGAHYMNLKAVSGDGTFHVISWGNNYCLKAADITKGVWFLKMEY